VIPKKETISLENSPKGYLVLHTLRLVGLATHGVLFYLSIAILVAFTLSLIFPIVSYAQEGSGKVLQQLKNKEILPKEILEKPVIENKEEKAKEIVDGKKIFIRQINVEGVTLINKQAIQAIISKYENKELTLSEIEQIANDITSAYNKEGFILARAYIPPQEIKNWVLEIKVIEGKIGKITATGNKSYSSRFIENHLLMVKKDPSLNEESLERALLILNEYPDLNVKAVLKAGKEFDTTDIQAEVKDARPVSGSLSYDNFGSDTTSKNRLSGAFNIGNLLTSGDYLMLNGITGLDSIDFNKLSYGRIEYRIPIDSNGTKLGVYYSNSIYQAGEQYTILNLHGNAHVAGIYLTYPVIRETEKALDVRAGFDYEDVYDYVLGDTNSKDNIRVFNISATYDFVDSLYGRNILNLTYYQGVRGLFGGSGENDAGTSRSNADGAFNKLTADIERNQKLPGDNYLVLKASGQISSKPLFAAEQFYLGGEGSVRGFEPSSVSGDSGYFASTELYLMPPYPNTIVFNNQKLKDTLNFVLFIDNGGVYRNNVQPGESTANHLTSIGTGLRLYAGKHFSVMYDWAVPEIEGKFKTSQSEHYLQVTTNF
jgi:hemolysin activation/secretion protein